MSIQTREFAGIEINATETHVMSLNSKEGDVQVNLQELMAYHLESGKTWYHSTKRDDVAQEFGISYNLIEQCRESENWDVAKNELLSLNPNLNLSEQQKKKLARKEANNGNGKSASDKVKFTTTHAKNLGNAIFESLPTEYKKYVANFDMGNSYYKDANSHTTGHCASVGIKYFVKAIVSSANELIERQRRLEEERAHQEQLAKEQAIRDRAELTATALGIEKPADNATEEEVSAYKTRMQALIELATNSNV